jgi:hypothetical protein
MERKRAREKAAYRANRARYLERCKQYVERVKKSDPAKHKQKRATNNAASTRWQKENRERVRANKRAWKQRIKTEDPQRWRQMLEDGREGRALKPPPSDIARYDCKAAYARLKARPEAYARKLQRDKASRHRREALARLSPEERRKLEIAGLFTEDLRDVEGEVFKEGQRKSARDRERARELRAERIGARLCTWCGKPRAEGQQLCAFHRDMQRERQRKPEALKIKSGRPRK